MAESVEKSEARLELRCARGQQHRQSICRRGEAGVVRDEDQEAIDDRLRERSFNER
jgi:hypothetical protein